MMVINFCFWVLVLCMLAHGSHCYAGMCRDIHTSCKFGIVYLAYSDDSHAKYYNDNTSKKRMEP